LLAQAGAAQVLVLPFTADLARLSPRGFLEQVLRDSLKTSVVIVGENFRFGYRQEGDAETLRKSGAELGFTCFVVPPVIFRGEMVSSSAIRRHLRSRKIAQANRLLGRCFSLAGPVVSGFGIGSKQTVPTLNLRPVPGQVLPRGVFVTETVELSGSRRWQSITNVGSRPTFAGEEVTIETFLLSPFEEPAPDRIRVEFRHFLRDERAFPDPSALRTQILRDVSRAKTYWRRITSLRKAVPSIY
jgi:riboflavin kinase / FMN adenylyltransferase